MTRHEAAKMFGRPWGGGEFIERLEKTLGRRLKPGRAGRKPKRRNGEEK